MSVMYIRDKNGNLIPVRTIQGEKGEQGPAGESGQNGVSPVVTVSKSGKVTTITITDVNGTKTATITDGVDGVDGVGADGASSESVYSLLGQTPQTISTMKTVKLSADEECAYTVKSHTVTDFPIGSASPVNATLTQSEDIFTLAADSAAESWYQAYVDVTVSGLTVGETYNFVFDAANVSWNTANHITVGHYIVYDGDGNTLVTRAATDGAVMHVHSFVATTETARIRWYPAANNTCSPGESVANVRRIYINREGTTAHTEIIDLSGTFSGTTLLGALPGGVTIESEPACYVYTQGGTASEAAGRHAGKKCICFGDSVTGNMDAPYDYPSVIAQETGMDVVNAGFGGCRMSDTHPTACYAAFSMVKLAEAVASGDWTTQEALVGEMSEATNAVAHLAQLQAVEWSNVDFVTIAYGTNDIGSGVTIDDAADSESTVTYLGALRYILRKMLTVYPHLKVLLITPIYRYWNEEGVDSDEKLFDSRKFTDWGDGLLTVAQEYKIPALDLYRILGFNSITRSYFFPDTDGTHPNRLGQKQIGEKIAAKLLAEY